MKGEKVSTPLDKDGRGPSGLYNTHTVKALPPTSWHLTMFFFFVWVLGVILGGGFPKNTISLQFLSSLRFSFSLTLKAPSGAEPQDDSLLPHSRLQTSRYKPAPNTSKATSVLLHKGEPAQPSYRPCFQYCSLQD